MSFPTNPQKAALIAQLDAKIVEVDALTAKGAGITQEDLTNIGTKNAELASLQEQIKAWGAVDDAMIASERAKSFLSDPVQNPAFKAAMNGGQGGAQVVGGFQQSGKTFLDDRGYIESVGAGLLSQKQWDAIGENSYKLAFGEYLRKGLQGLGATALKGLSEGTDADGGYLVPQDFLRRLIEKRATPTRILGMVTQIPTSGKALTVPKVNYSSDDVYTTGVRATWTGEIPSSSTAHRATNPQFAQQTFPVYTAMLSLDLTNDLIEDAAFPLEDWVSGKFAETDMLLGENMIFNGTGVGQPSGILKAPGTAGNPAIVYTGDAGLVTPAGLQDLAYAVPEQYDDNLHFFMNKTSTARAIGAFKDGEGRFLWGNGVQDSGLSVDIRNRTLLGYPVPFSAFMPNIAANAFPIIFGDPRGYYRITRVGFSIQILREVAAQTNQIIVLGRTRFGGAVAEDWRLKVQKVAVAP